MAKVTKIRLVDPETMTVVPSDVPVMVYLTANNELHARTRIDESDEDNKDLLVQFIEEDDL